MQRFLCIVLFASISLQAADGPEDIFTLVRALDIPELERVRPLSTLAALVVVDNAAPYCKAPIDFLNDVLSRECLDQITELAKSGVVEAKQGLRKARDRFGWGSLSHKNFALQVARPLVTALQCGLRPADIGWSVNEHQKQDQCPLPYSETLIFLAACNGLNNLVQALHTIGADPNLISGEWELSALEGAAVNDHPDTVRLLFELGAVYDFDDAIYQEDAQVQREYESLLDGWCGEPEPLKLEEDVEMIRALAENGVPCNPDYYGIVRRVVPNYLERLQVFNDAYKKRIAAELEVLAVSGDDA